MTFYPTVQPTSKKLHPNKKGFDHCHFRHLIPCLLVWGIDLFHYFFGLTQQNGTSFNCIFRIRLEKEMATDSRILAWKFHGQRPGGPGVGGGGSGSQRVGYDPRCMKFLLQ